METEKTKLEIRQLQAKGKIVELLKSELESGNSDEWEDVENDLSEHEKSRNFPQ